jgi:hypothetical protein
VYILKGLVGRIAGKNFETLALIMSKSGANVQIEQASVMASGGIEMCKIIVVGVSQGVTLAGQMIQEVFLLGIFLKLHILCYVYTYMFVYIIDIVCT